jgi:hypothetical protein
MMLLCLYRELLVVVKCEPGFAVGERELSVRITAVSVCLFSRAAGSRPVAVHGILFLNSVGRCGAGSQRRDVVMRNGVMLSCLVKKQRI